MIALARLILVFTVALGWVAAHFRTTDLLAQEPAKTKSTVSSEASNSAHADSGVKPPTGYKVGVDDELTVSVWHEPEFSQSVVVRPDGMITLPLLNDIRVIGLSTEEVRDLLTEKLKSLVNDPQVTIIVRAIRSLKVFLAGSVQKQGTYPLTSGLTVLQLITQGGGLSPFAKSGSIYILRNENGKQVRISFNYKKALRGKSEDPVLQSGDMVVVP